VVARTSAFALKYRNADVREIGRALNVGFVLEGSVRKSGECAARDGETGQHFGRISVMVAALRA
jgi:hypothetical protein